LFVQDLEWRIFPPILLEQCKLYFDNKAGQLPVAFASWALFSESAERDYLAHQRIAPSNWNSGDRLWLIDFISPFGGSRSIFTDIYQSVLKGRDVNLLYPGANGTPTQVKLRDLITPAKSTDDHVDEPAENSVHH
jgi:cytolysin-activating lysine-acyltransferase